MSSLTALLRRNRPLISAVISTLALALLIVLFADVREGIALRSPDNLTEAGSTVDATPDDANSDDDSRCSVPGAHGCPGEDDRPPNNPPPEDPSLDDPPPDDPTDDDSPPNDGDSCSLPGARIGCRESNADDPPDDDSPPNDGDSCSLPGARIGCLENNADDQPPNEEGDGGEIESGVEEQALGEDSD